MKLHGCKLLICRHTTAETFLTNKWLTETESQELACVVYLCLEHPRGQFCSLTIINVRR